MSQNKKRLLGCLFVVFLLSGALVFAVGRSHQTDVSSTDASTSAAITQRKFNPTHDMTVEMISVGPEGFQPAELTRPSGRFLLAVNNRSGLEEVSLQLIREDGKVMHQARVNRKQPNWRSIVNLPAGTYRLTETSHADWVCRIVVTPQR